MKIRPTTPTTTLTTLVDKRVEGMSDRNLNIPKTLFRTGSFDRASGKEEDRTIELSFSSEAPVERGFGMEILDHSPESVDLARLRSSGPLLFNHDRDMHVGRVVTANVAAGVGRATVKFSNSTLGQEKFRDVLDGILTEVSVGYQINDMTLERAEGGVETYRVTAWEPGEVSLVTMPADVSVGVGRAAEESSTDTKSITIRTMSEDTKTTPAAAPVAPVVDTAAVRASVLKDERGRVNGINEAARVLATNHPGKATELRAVAEKCIADGHDQNDFNRSVLADILNTAPVRGITQSKTGASVGLKDKDVSRYSMLKAIRSQIDGKPLDGIERECSDEVAKIVGRSPKGFFLPDEVALPGRRTLTANPSSAGGYTVGEQMLSSEFVDYLRNNSKLMGMGARMVSGLTGDVNIPRQLTGATAYWVSETGTLTQSGATFGQILGKPKRVGTSVPYSTQFLAQTSLSAESFIRDDSQTAIAVELDRVGINGAGGAEPLGILKLAAADRSSSVTFGAAPTYAKYLEFFANVAGNNALIGTPKYLTTPASAAKAMAIQQFSGAGGPGIWTDQNKIGVFGAEWSTNFPAGDKAIFGDFSQVMYLEWAGFDVIVDPYTGKKEGTVEVTINRLMDMVIRRGKSFAISTDSAAQ